MKILMITPSNMQHMPYVDNYKKILTDSSLDVSIINWDRQHLEEKSELSYRDKSKSIKKNFVEYYKYYSFLKKKITADDYDVVIIFGLQLLFFLQRYIIKNEKVKFILDIRDKNKIVYFMNLKKIFKKFEKIVISSEAYKEWLPKNNYLINHNTELGLKDELLINNKKASYNKNQVIKITALGSLRDFTANKRIIDSLKNDEQFQLDFYGDGDVIGDLQEISTTYENIAFHSRYDKKDEKKIAESSSFINVLRYPDSENNRTALPNRLYLAAELGIPLLAYEGTYLSEVIKKNQLGLVLNDKEKIDEQILCFLEDSNYDNSNYCRESFLRFVYEENLEFKNEIIKLLE